MSTIELKRIHKSYGQGTGSTPVLRGINFTVEQGEILASMGPSGSGKSTLMNILGLLDIPSDGEYTLAGHDTARLSSRQAAQIRKNKIGFIFQNFNLLPRQHVIDNIIIPMIYQRMPKLKREKRAHDLLAQVGLTERGFYFPSQLSGGQKQRVAVARALANNPTIILADEPTGKLDTETGQQIIDLLKELNKKGHTIIIVTHDENIAGQTDRIIRIVDGRVKSDTSEDVNNSDRNAQPYAEYMENTVPEQTIEELGQPTPIPAVEDDDSADQYQQKQLEESHHDHPEMEIES